MALTVLNENAPPEIRLVNQLASAGSNEQVQQLLENERERLDQSFLELVEQALRNLQQDERQEGAEMLRYAAEQIKVMIAAE